MNGQAPGSSEEDQGNWSSKRRALEWTRRSADRKMRQAAAGPKGVASTRHRPLDRPTKPRHGDRNAYNLYFEVFDWAL